MPKRPLKSCNKVGCPELIEAGNTYCDKHANEVENKRQRRYDRYQRNKKASKFYSTSRWQKVRNKKLKLNPLCEHCFPDDVVIATEVDHFIPIGKDWSLRLSISNMQSLCHPCHMKKTIQEKKRKEKIKLGRGRAG